MIGSNKCLIRKNPYVLIGLCCRMFILIIKKKINENKNGN
jgi:hypothetical protein